MLSYPSKREVSTPVYFLISYHYRLLFDFDDNRLYAIAEDPFRKSFRKWMLFS